MLGNHVLTDLRNKLCPAGSLPSLTAGSTRSGAPSADLGELLGPGAGQGTTAPRMSNAMARSLGLVPPKETRTRTLGEQHTHHRHLTLGWNTVCTAGVSTCLKPLV